jgi:hypothetical protein
VDRRLHGHVCPDGAATYRTAWVRRTHRCARIALCLSIVAVFQLHSAAATVSEDVPLPGGTAALAKLLGIDPVPERGRFVYEITRILYNTPEGRRPSADAYLAALRQAVARGTRGFPQIDTRPGDSVPVPLTADLWSTAIFKRTVSPRDLIPAILADRSAALICLGLTALDDRTIAYFADHPSLLERIYVRSATAFGAFSSSLQIDGNRVVPPGGPRPSDAAAPPPQGSPQAERDDVDPRTRQPPARLRDRPRPIVTMWWRCGKRWSPKRSRARTVSSPSCSS